MPRGGYYPGGGRPKGSKSSKTIEKEIALKQVQQMVLKEVIPLFRSALNSATGLTVMFQRKKVKNKITKKFERTGDLVRVVDVNRVEDLLKGTCSGEDWYYITTKDPNIQALKELLDRTFGKSKESLELTGLDGGPVEIGVTLKSKIDKIYGQ